MGVTENMHNRFIEYGELQDEKILKALAYAHDDYDNGAILEVRNLLKEIVEAIDEWSYNYSL